MLRLFGAQPLVSALVWLAVIVFVVYRIVSGSHIGPLEAIALIVGGILLVRAPAPTSTFAHG